MTDSQTWPTNLDDALTVIAGLRERMAAVELIATLEARKAQIFEANKDRLAERVRELSPMRHHLHSANLRLNALDKMLATYANDAWNARQQANRAEDKIYDAKRETEAQRQKKAAARFALAAAEEVLAYRNKQIEDLTTYCKDSWFQNDAQYFDINEVKIILRRDLPWHTPKPITEYLKDEESSDPESFYHAEHDDR